MSWAKSWSLHVDRGGSWIIELRYTRVAYCGGSPSDSRNDFRGVRFVRRAS